MKDKFKVNKPFSIIDIYLKRLPDADFTALLKELKHKPVNFTWFDFKSVQKSEILSKNLDWLKKEGLIEKEEYLWINVYESKGYRTKEAAVRGISRTGNHGKYVTTIQLKPETP